MSGVLVGLVVFSQLDFVVTSFVSGLLVILASFAVGEPNLS